jgi:hypothetical protein
MTRPLAGRGARVRPPTDSVAVNPSCVTEKRSEHPEGVAMTATTLGQPIHVQFRRPRQRRKLAPDAASSRWRMDYHGSSHA